MSYVKLPELEETGYVVLESYDQSQDPQEWLDIEFVDWKSSGDTRFAPLASAYGDLECNGFWHHNPPKTDKDGVWVDANIERAPRLKARAEEPGANIGRCRVIELQPNEYADCIWNLHQDDNNRLNPEGTGWIVRGFFNLTDNPDSYMILREDNDGDAHPVAVRRPGDHRHATPLACGVAHRRRTAVLPHHLLGVRSGARRVHPGAQPEEQGGQRSAGSERDRRGAGIRGAPSC
jgi:hypothetical protein